MNSIVQDQSGHWYVIPSIHRQWWVDYSADEDNFVLPVWAKPLSGSPKSVCFGDYLID